MLKNKKGSALLLTLFLLSGIMIVAFAGSYLVMAGLRASAMQYDSARAYFVAESGAEYALFEIRHGKYDLDVNPSNNIFNGDMTASYNGTYSVDYKSFHPIILTATGSYSATKRSVELNF